MNEAWFKARALAAKQAADFIRAHPDGVTWVDLKAAGIPRWGLDRAVKFGSISVEQVREPERGPRAFHWVWKPIHRAEGGAN